MENKDYLTLHRALELESYHQLMLIFIRSASSFCGSLIDCKRYIWGMISSIDSAITSSPSRKCRHWWSLSLNYLWFSSVTCCFNSFYWASGLISPLHQRARHWDQRRFSFLLTVVFVSGIFSDFFPRIWKKNSLKNMFFFYCNFFLYIILIFYYLSHPVDYICLTINFTFIKLKFIEYTFNLKKLLKYLSHFKQSPMWCKKTFLSSASGSSI